MSKRKKKIVTHDGSFHSDDVFACATIALYLEQEGKDYEIIRSREEDVVENGDYVFDVGGVYDEGLNKFDHHQREGSGQRENGIPYASFGLAWKHFGLDLCDDNKEVWEMIDRKIASPIDAIDNGVDLSTPKFKGIYPYSGDQTFLIYSPTWKERELNINEIFVEQVEKAKELLSRELKVAKDDAEGRKILLDAYEEAEDKRIIRSEFSFPRYLYQGVYSSLPEPVYFVFPSEHGNNWKVEAISKSPETFESRKKFPEEWRGFVNHDPKLIEVTGIEDVIFSHRNGFLMTAKSKESVIKLAKKALEFKSTSS